MALVSPGVEVTVIDESNYLPAATNSVPYILIATAQNKISGTGVGVAAGTLAANAGKVYTITSQRDLSATFGVPFFYKTSAGTPINGYELNEYGLLAAYSALGISNRAYVQRANVDLAELTASLVRPVGTPADGTYWLDTTATSWGIFQFNATTGAFTAQTPIVISSDTQLSGGVPLPSVGSIGNYAVNTTSANNTVFYKNSDNTWVEVGTNNWMSSWPSIQGQNSVVGNVLTPTDTITINAGNSGAAITIAASPNNNITYLANQINTESSISGVSAAVDSSNRLVIYANSDSSADGSTVGTVSVTGTSNLLTTLGITAGTYNVPALKQSPNYTVPLWRTTDARPTGSVWNVTNAVNQGTDIIVKKFSGTLGVFVGQSAPVYEDDAAANKALDPAGGGQNIPAGTTYTQYNVLPEEYQIGSYNNTFTLELFERTATGPTVIAGANDTPVFGVGNAFTLSSSSPNSSTMSVPVTVTLTGTTVATFISDVSGANVPYVSASVTSSGALAFTHSKGGVIEITETNGTPITGTAGAEITTDIPGVRDSGTGSLILSNWTALTYIASATEPDQDPADGRYWYYSATNQVDIMINDNGTWMGYQNVNPDVRGYDLSSTDPNGPIISASVPLTQSDGITALVYGDLWIDTSNLELYPVIKRWQQIDGVNQWVTIDNTDQTTSNGILFADARWAPNGTTNPVSDNFPTITSLLTSDYLDPDAPDATLYPAGTLLWNTRRSGFNVKSFQSNYFNPTRFNFDEYGANTAYVVNDRVLYNGTVYICIQNANGQNPATQTAYWSPFETNTWLTVSGNRNNGSPYMGRQAVRQIVVAAMKSAIDTQDTLREEQLQFNLIACPQYPELIPNMVALNNERSNTGFVIGDTPLRLPPTGTDITAWATNANAAASDNEAGLVTSDAYLGTFYPSCQTTDLSGSVVVQPPSHMMIRTIIRSDEVAYPWLAPAGVRRGVIDNAIALGYVNGQTGEFQTIATGQGIRDVLYTNKINPITFIPGVGITNYGNKTESSVTSALDRINVARLVAFIRGRLNEIGKTFVFEPNDQITRNEITNAINGLMIDLVAKRGIYDYLVVCDDSNNTPARIDRNELWVDIAIEPVKAVEFIYIPVRIKNTGEIAAGQVASSATV